MTALRWVVVLIIVIFLGIGAYNLIQTNKALEKKAAALAEEARKIGEENKKLASQLEYLKNPYNLLKEVKANFNYREAGEELIIIVPPKKENRAEP